MIPTEPSPAASADRLTFASWLGGLCIAAAFSLVLPMAVLFWWSVAHAGLGPLAFPHSPVMTVLLPVLGEAAMVLGAWLVLRRRLPLYSFGLHRLTLTDLWFALGFFAWNLAVWLGVSNLLDVQALPAQVQQARLWAQTWWAIPAIALAAGVCEEIMFRGYLLLGLVKLKPNLAWLWLLLSTGLFAVGHVDWGISRLSQMIPFLAFGLAAGLIVLRTRRLYPVIIGHFIWDAFVPVFLLHR